MTLLRLWIAASIFVLVALQSGAALESGAAQPNLLIITADDMNWDSVGCYGCPLEGVTPAIDRLARQGIRFEHAHVASTACYPSRSAISTGRRGHRSGGEGFLYLRFPDVPTVQQLLHDNGYRVGILGKVKHGIPGRIASNPVKISRWDDAAQEKETDTKPTDEARKARRAARRAAEKAKQK